MEHPNFNAKDKMGFKGEYFVFSLPDWMHENHATIKMLREFLRTGNQAILQGLQKSGIVLDFKHSVNVIPITGRNILARVLSGNQAITSGKIDYGALGTVATVFDENDTVLGNEVFRKAPSSRGDDGDIAYIDWFITAGDVADQTFEEFGAFIGGSALADTGSAFSLVATGGWVKSGSIFIAGKYTLTSAT